MAKTSTLSQRNLPLDVFRGMTVALMIVVNNPGSWKSIYAPFQHSEWHGFTLTDLVFPTFLFVVGNAMSFTRKNIDIGATAFFSKVVKRTLIIFIIGFLLNYFPFFHFVDGKFMFTNILDVRIWGVLQRIALCYLLANVMIYYLNKTWIIITSILILLFYWGILYYFGQPTDPYSLTGNVVKDVDLFLFDAKNLYKGFDTPFDPSGLLSTLPATVNVLAGYLIGLYVQKDGSKTIRALKMMGLSVVFLVTAMGWDSVFPINKPLWTSSYVLLSIGWDLFILAMLMLIIDALNFKKWTYFFVVFGKNPLFIYIISWIVIKILYLIPAGDVALGSYAYRTLFQQWMDVKNASLAFAITYMLLMWLVCLVMDKKKIYIKV